MVIKLPDPEIQVLFAEHLAEARSRLQPALLRAVGEVGADAIDRQVRRLVPEECRTLLARRGLRAELVFAVPVLLQHAPQLLGYYRLLLGFSQKVFYTTKTGLTPFAPMEQRGELPERCRLGLTALCRELVQAGSYLLLHFGANREVTAGLLHELTVLTLGAQLRGSVNNTIGERGVTAVFGAIRLLLADHVVNEDAGKRIEILNAANRRVVIAFASDPDIVIRERLSTGEDRNVIAIEIKGGHDVSNIHNRVGEAEKSHQKARKAGFVECWTIINIDRFDEAKLRRESPATDRFFRLSAIAAHAGSEFADFGSRLRSLTGVRE